MSDELFTAIDKHDVRAVARLLSEGADPNAQLTHPPEWRPLGAAIEELEFGGSLEIVRLLIGHGAQVNLPYIGDKLTPLHAAMFVENMEAVQMLLAAGANPNALTDEDRSPLRFAVEQGSLEMAKLFLERGATATINESGGFCGCTALGLAARKLNTDMLKLLLEAGADPEATDSDGFKARDHLPEKEDSNPSAWDRAFELLTSQD